MRLSVALVAMLLLREGNRCPPPRVDLPHPVANTRITIAKVRLTAEVRSETEIARVEFWATDVATRARTRIAVDVARPFSVMWDVPRSCRRELVLTAVAVTRCGSIGESGRVRVMVERCAP